MKKFFDVVKVNFEDEISSYFENVEVESIKMTKDKKALNFYLVSKYIIPYDIITEAEDITSKELYGNKDNYDYSERYELPKKVVNFKFRYELDPAWNCKNIFEKIENDFYRELKVAMPTAKAFIKKEYTEFTDDNTLKLGFDHISSFETKQYEIVDYIKKLYKERYDKDITINIQWLENNYSSGKVVISSPSGSQFVGASTQPVEASTQSVGASSASPKVNIPSTPIGLSRSYGSRGRRSSIN